MKSSLAKSFLRGFGTGYVASPFASELYLHEYLAHQTLLLSKKAAKVGWFLTRITGLNPTTWSINHRMHHGPEKQEPLPPFRALLVAIRTGTVGLKTAQAVVANPENEAIITFPGRPVESDPVLKRAPDGTIEPRFSNRFDAWLSRRPVLDRGAGPVAFAAVIGTANYMKEKSPRRAAATAVSSYAGYVLGMMGPGLAVSAYPERRTGFSHGSEAGVDGGKIAQVLCGRFAMHRSHHEHPELAMPPGTTIDRDALYVKALEVIGQGQEYDGIA